MAGREGRRAGGREGGRIGETHLIFLARSKLSMSSSCSFGVLNLAKGRSLATSSRSSCGPRERGDSSNAKHTSGAHASAHTNHGYAHVSILLT